MPIVRLQDKLPTCLIIFLSRPTISYSLLTTLRLTDTILRFLSFHVLVSFRAVVLKPEYTYTWKYTKEIQCVWDQFSRCLATFYDSYFMSNVISGCRQLCLFITPFFFVCFLVSFPPPFRIHIYTSLLDRLLDISICYSYLQCVH